MDEWRATVTDSDKKIKVQASFVTKRYEMAPTNADKMKAALSNKTFPSFWALRGVSFTAYEGETIAVVGTNGSGKSTLMKVMSGIIPATSGEMKVNGAVSLIAINAGLRGNMSGRENIRLKGLMMGMSNQEIDQKMDDIIAFSELGDFIDQQVKNYSSGMKSKLGFSISVHADPDILIIDEALSVGDATFNRKSLEKIREFQAQGKTIFFVSHDLQQVREMADRVLWLHFGKVRMFGPTNEVMDHYDEFVNEYKQLSQSEQAQYRSELRDAQEQFTLDDLYHETVSDVASTQQAKQLKKEIYYEQHPSKMARWEKWIIVVLACLTILVGDKIALNLGFKTIVEKPATLVTGWTPKKLHALDERHAKETKEKAALHKQQQNGKRKESE